MDIQLRHLRLVQRVAREGTLTAAARSLHLSQSALSHQLAQLERRVGSPVFERSGRRMKPTPFGRRILEGANEVLSAIRTLENDLADLAAGRRGTLRITAECFTCYHWLGDVLPAFRAAHAGIDLRLVPEATSDPLVALAGDEVDLVLSYGDHQGRGLESRPLFVDEQVLLVPPGHPLATRDFVVAEDLEGEHLLLYHDRPGESLFFSSVLDPAGVRPARISGVRLTEGILAMVAAGGGVAAMTRWTAAPDIAAGRVVALRIGRFGLQREWRAYFAAGGRPKYLEDFVELLRGGPARLFADRPAERAAAGILES